MHEEPSAWHFVRPVLASLVVFGLGLLLRTVAASKMEDVHAQKASGGSPTTPWVNERMFADLSQPSVVFSGGCRSCFLVKILEFRCKLDFSC